MKIKVLSTSDVHAHVYPTDYTTKNDYHPFGMLKIADKINEIKASAQDDEIIITIENGDWIQGSPFANFLVKKQPDTGSIFTQITQQIGYDAGILGNHEFNYGLGFLNKCESKRNYPILGANIIDQKQRKITDCPYKIIEKSGVKVGIIGLTTQYIPKWEKKDNIEGLKFESAFKTAKHFVPIVRKLADVVIVAYHGGFESDPVTGIPTEPQTGENEGYKILAEVPGIDALVTGHQHRELSGIYNEVAVTQPGCNGEYIGEIQMDLSEDLSVISREASLISVSNNKFDMNIAKMTDSIEDDVEEWLDQPLGHITGDSLEVQNHLQARLHGHPFLQFINEIQMDNGQVDIAATPLFNDAVQGFKRHVTVRQLLNSYSYPNTLVVENISGLDLKKALERCASFFDVVNGEIVVNKLFKEPKVQYYNYDFYSGIEYCFDLNAPIGHRVKRFTYHNKDIRDDQNLKIAMNYYRGNGGGEYSMYSNNKIIKEIDTEIVDLIIDYFEKHPNYIGKDPNNLKIIF